MSRFEMPAEDVLRAREKVVLDCAASPDFTRAVSTRSSAPVALLPSPTATAIAPAAFPDQDHEIVALRHSADAVIVEFWLLGTHRGPLGAIPPTGGRHRTRMTAFFVFDDDENLVTERVYFDTLTMLKQLMGKVNLRNPRSWPLVIKALRGLSSMSSTPDPRITSTPPADLS